MTSIHECPIHGCSRRVRRQQLLCPHHWYMVPVELRREVWREFRREPLSMAHLAACAAAVRAVHDLLQVAR